MKRFTTGLLLGATTSGIAYAAGADLLLTAVLGAVVAAVIWFAELLAR